MPLALTAAVALVVVLSLQTRSLRDDVARERRRGVLTSAGQVVPPVWAGTIAGDSTLLGGGQPGTGQVLFVFNVSCAICLQTLPAWRRILTALSSEPGLSLIGWSHDPDSITRAYVTRHALSFPSVVVGVSRKYIRLYHVQAVPSTLVLDAAGNVLFGRPGALTRMAEDSLIAIARGSIRRDIGAGGNRGITRFRKEGR
jgi:hypothetical protein